SDHGYLLGEKFMWGKVMLFEQCDRVPLIVRVPEGIGSVSTTPGTSSDGLVELIDLFPTLAELCEITPPAELQGQSLVSMLKDPQSAGKEVAYTVVTRGEHLGKAIRTQRHHYTHWSTGEELYDLSLDPYEETNLANSSKHNATLEMMRKHLAKSETSAIAAQRPKTKNIDRKNRN
ncbi:MAG: sulfatase/phosphatase domain-containing protein, partial [Rubripirellula sp.]